MTTTQEEILKSLDYKYQIPCGCRQIRLSDGDVNPHPDEVPPAKWAVIKHCGKTNYYCTPCFSHKRNRPKLQCTSCGEVLPPADLFVHQQYLE